MEFGEACYLNAGLTPSAEKLGSVDYPKFGLELRIPLWLRTAGVLDAGGKHAHSGDGSRLRVGRLRHTDGVGLSLRSHRPLPSRPQARLELRFPEDVFVQSVDQIFNAQLESTRASTMTVVLGSPPPHRVLKIEFVAPGLTIRTAVPAIGCRGSFPPPPPPPPPHPPPPPPPFPPPRPPPPSSEAGSPTAEGRASRHQW